MVQRKSAEALAKSLHDLRRQAYCLRRQIELAFKRLKSLLHIDRLRTRTETGTRCWVQAHLIMALLCDEFRQNILGSLPCGAC